MCVNARTPNMSLGRFITSGREAKGMGGEEMMLSDMRQKANADSDINRRSEPATSNRRQNHEESRYGTPW